MPAPQNLRATGDRLSQLLDDLQATTDPRTYDRASELLRLVSELYGAGLARTVEIVGVEAPAALEALTHDDLVASLLLVHGLHPASLEQRVEEALTKVRPLLAAHAGDVELLGIDADSGTVSLRLLGSCDGCPSSSVTLRLAVERAITDAAPEIVHLDVDQPAAQAASIADVPVALGTKPRYDECPAEMAET